MNANFPDTQKYVLIVAPHTSNWDFPLGILAAKALELEPRWMGKHTIFKWPVAWFFRALGGIPIDRNHAVNTIEQMASLFKQSERLVLALAPEGTRSRQNHWKTGFYHIARGAKVPIAMAFLDYPRKQIGMGGTFEPGADIEEVFVRIEAFYADRRGKHPELECPIRVRPSRKTSEK